MRMSQLLMVSSKSTPSARFARGLPLARGRLSLLLPHQAGGPADRVQNRAVAGAAAKVAIHVAHNLSVRGFGVLFKERLGGKDHSRRAEAALKCELIEERLLDGVKPLAVADPLDRRDPPSPGFISKVCARADGQTVNECGASTAHLYLARNLQSSQVAPVSKNFSQGFLRFEIELDRFSVQDERNLHEVDSFPAVENWACNRSANWARSSLARRRIGRVARVARLPVAAPGEPVLR